MPFSFNMYPYILYSNYVTYLYLEVHWNFQAFYRFLFSILNIKIMQETHKYFFAKYSISFAEDELLDTASQQWDIGA